MKIAKFNELIWATILMSFAYCILYLFISKNIYYYLHPRMFGYTIFALIVFTILALT